MAEQSKPNTFTAGMVTDLDPSFQPQDSYNYGKNVRVVTNGDKSFSLENIRGLNEELKETLIGTDADFITHGAVVIEDYLVRIKKQNKAIAPNWEITTSTINNDGTLSSEVSKWNGTGLFHDDAQRIHIEAIAETETTHRIYCTDGLTTLKSINLKTITVSDDVSEFFAFKPNVMKPVELSAYKEVGGNLKYGSYAYVYRLASQSQTNFTDWSVICDPINVVKGSLSSNTSLGVEGESSALNSSAALDLSISDISTDFDRIQIAAIYYSSENVQVINIVEEGSITSSTYTFTHSGFETETLVSGGIAAAIINNEKWDSCKTLAQKDNKLYAANLKSTIFDIDAEVASWGKLKSFKYSNSGSDYPASGQNWDIYGTTYAGDVNPHRHYNGSDNNWSWSGDYEEDKNIYKFIGKNLSGISAILHGILGAETNQGGTAAAPNTPTLFSEGGFGYRLTFQQESYPVDEFFNKYPDGTGSVDQTSIPPIDNFNLADAGYSSGIYSVGTSNNSATYAGGIPGPHNPAWDKKFRSFKRGECYRFGIVFYDKQGAPGFVHHIGDVKMPDALDQNIKVLNYPTYTGIVDKEHDDANATWCPFSDKSNNNNDDVMAHALIPVIEVRLPESVKNVISGYRIVRAELTDNDKTIITQGVWSTLEKHEDAEQDNENTKNRITPPGQPLHATKNLSGTGGDSNPFLFRVPWHLGLIDTPDVTLGGKSYDVGSGYQIRPVYMMMANRCHNISNTFYNHKYFGYDAEENFGAGGQGGEGFHLYKWKPWNKSIEGHDGHNAIAMKDIYQAYNGTASIFRWAKDIHLAKSVVNKEIITSAQMNEGQNLGMDYIHQTAVYKDGECDNAHSAGDMHPIEYSTLSRASQSGECPTGIFVSLGDDVVPLPGRVIISPNTTVPADHVSISSWEGNNFTSNKHTSGAYHRFYEGFKWLVEIIRDTSSGFEQYGGNTDSAIENTRFIPCSDFQNTSTGDQWITQINRGDVYLDWYTFKNMSRTLNTNIGFHYGTAVLLENNMNVALRSGTYLGKESVVSVNVEDNFLYNTAYSQENNLVGYTTKPTGFSTNDTFKAKVVASNTKILGELYDAWTVFPTNAFADLNLMHGQITSLCNYKNQLYSIQERGVSLLSVNSRALIQGEGAAADIQIVTGTGAEIERFDYLTTDYGAQTFNTTIKSPTGFYVYDNDKIEIIKCDGQSIIPLGITNNYKSFLISIDSSYNVNNVSVGVFGGYDPEFREIHYNLVKDNSLSNSFIISDLSGGLISETKLRDDTVTNDVSITNYITHKNSLYGICKFGDVSPNNFDEIVYKFNKGPYLSFLVTSIINDSPYLTKVFDNITIMTDAGILFSGYNFFNNIDTTYITSSNKKVREGNHLVSLRDDVNPRQRGNWLYFNFNYNQVLSGSSIDGDPNNNKKFNIFALTARTRPSR